MDPVFQHELVNLVRQVGPPVMRQLGPQLLRRIGPPLLRRLGPPLARHIGIPLARRIGLPIAKHIGHIAYRRIGRPLLKRWGFVLEPLAETPHPNSMPVPVTAEPVPAGNQNIVKFPASKLRSSTVNSAPNAGNSGPAQSPATRFTPGTCGPQGQGCYR